MPSFLGADRPAVSAVHVGGTWGDHSSWKVSANMILAPQRRHEFDDRQSAILMGAALKKMGKLGERSVPLFLFARLIRSAFALHRSARVRGSPVANFIARLVYSSMSVANNKFRAVNAATLAAY